MAEERGCHNRAARRRWITWLTGSYGELVLRNPEYRLLWLSDLASSTGEYFTFLAVLITMGSHSESSLTVSAFLLTRFVPPFLMSPVIGLVLDRYDRVTVLIVSNFVQTCVILCYLFVRGSEDIFFIFLISCIQFSAAAFFEPAHAGIMPNVVEEKDLLTANALDTTTWCSMLALGSFIGGIVVEIAGPKACFIVDASCFCLSNIFLWTLRARLAQRKEKEEQQDRIVTGEQEKTDLSLRGLHQAIRYFHENPGVFFMCFSKATDSIVYGTSEVVNIRIVETVFPNEISIHLGLTYLVVALAFGIGPISARWIPGINTENLWGMLTLIKISYALVFLGVATSAMGTSPWLHFWGNFLRCAGNGINYVYSAAFLQVCVPENFRGRVFAFESAINTLVLAMSQLLSGYAIDELKLSPIDVLQFLAMNSFFMMILWLGHFTTHRRFYERLVSAVPFDHSKHLEGTENIELANIDSVALLDGA